MTVASVKRLSNPDCTISMSTELIIYIKDEFFAQIFPRNSTFDDSGFFRTSPLPYNLSILDKSCFTVVFTLSFVVLILGKLSTVIKSLIYIVLENCLCFYIWPGQTFPSLSISIFLFAGGMFTQHSTYHKVASPY